MDESPLIKAHDHAKAAARATQASDTTIAINEHTLAAGEFALAANRTSSVEALRTLRLLEDHHKRLAELLKLPARAQNATKSATSANDDESAGDEDEKSQNEKPSNTTEGKQVSPSISSKTPGQIPSLAQPRFPQRNIAATITKNLNSARGIRSQYNGSTIAPSVTNDPASGSLEVASRKESNRLRMQNMLDLEKPTGSNGQSHDRRTSVSSSASTRGEDGYSRFYNAFGSIINRISSPLAFAGLPLISEGSSEPVPPPSIPEPITRQHGRSSTMPVKTLRQTEPSSSYPDLGKIYSGATVRAMQGLPSNESFYVVPPSGHTVSYANILSYADKEKRRLTASQHGGSSTPTSDDAETDFVDASEGLESQQKMRSSRLRSNDNDLQLVVDELRHQNENLNNVVGTLQKRLQLFEASAQNLTESRIMRPKSPSESSSNLRIPSPSHAGPYTEDNLKRVNFDLEQKLNDAHKRMAVLEKDNEKLQKKLRKYIEQWESLKESAKARRAPAATTEDRSTTSNRII
ncbi:hypothetical protein TD95_004405 [Thielaviopsis punctulata]|uniref:Uncharacterized protein n=1 Tax=Thielaviopsis punctulata TaxID=72032 RepID=A0A0F4ZJI3_9PEZI|nr:hypothetical protein TD95_004405 [Thielaviopsis punctulata]